MPTQKLKKKKQSLPMKMLIRGASVHLLACCFFGTILLKSLWCKFNCVTNEHNNDNHCDVDAEDVYVDDDGITMIIIMMLMMMMFMLTMMMSMLVMMVRPRNSCCSPINQSLHRAPS